MPIHCMQVKANNTMQVTANSYCMQVTANTLNANHSQDCMEAWAETLTEAGQAMHELDP